MLERSCVGAGEDVERCKKHERSCVGAGEDVERCKKHAVKKNAAYCGIGLPSDADKFVSKQT